MFTHLRYTLVCAMTLLALIGTEVAQAQPLHQGPVPPAQLLGQLTATNPQARVSVHNGTGKVRFIGSPNGQPLVRTNALRSAATVEGAAQSFMESYGSLFGVRSPATGSTSPI